MGEVRQLQGDPLPQGRPQEPLRLPEVRLPLPHLRARAARHALRRRLGGVRPGPGERRPPRLPRQPALRAAAAGGQGQDGLLRRARLRGGAGRGTRTVAIGAMEYGFIGGSMGVVVGEKVTRCHRAGARGEAAPRRGLLLGRRAHDGGHALAHADGEDLRRPRAAARGEAALRQHPDRPHHRRRHRLLRDARGPQRRGAGRAHRLRRTPGHRADHPAEAARGLPALGVPARARDARHGGGPARAQEGARPLPALLMG